MSEFGLIIDDDGQPGLYRDVEAAKDQVLSEMKAHYGDGWKDTCQLVWQYPIDANYETASHYCDDEWYEDLDYQVWYVESA